jgi:hypothetical protein
VDRRAPAYPARAGHMPGNQAVPRSPYAAGRRQTMLVARRYRWRPLYPCKRSGHMVFLKKLTVVRAAY